MVTWDDHEVTNDYGGPHERRDTDPAAFDRRRAAAYRAFFENMPLRRRSHPQGARLQLYRSLDWGRLAQFQLLDTRQYRPQRTCLPEAAKKRIPADCAERFDPSRSLMGAAQEAWLQQRFRTTSARWNVLTQQYLMSSLKAADGTVSNDDWGGYDANRRRVLQGWRDAKVANPVAVGGDIHSFIAADLICPKDRHVVGSEFVGGSISSLARADAIPADAYKQNPHLKFTHTDHRGFGLLDVTEAACQISFQGVDNAFLRGSPARQLARFVIEAGKPGLLRA